MTTSLDDMGDWRQVCGIDEAGRGPLAGPVVAAAVVLPRAFDGRGITDSKLLDERKRVEIARHILKTAIVSVATASAETIDRVNIRVATLWAMRRAHAGLPFRPDLVLIDGLDVPADLDALGFGLVKGDRLSQSVAAASIVAKVIRDDLMRRLGESLPAYGFERHKGYGTLQHRTALRDYGPSGCHRMSFRPVREAVPVATLA